MTNLGYLIWEKIPEECLFGAEGSELLAERAKAEMLATIRELKARRVTHIRTGISWAEWETPGGRELIAWYIRKCHDAGLDILPDFMFTPPSKGIKPQINSAPQKIQWYAEYVDDVCRELGSCFDEIEQWNEFNLETDWDPDTDPDYSLFVQMNVMAALVARHHSKKVVLGGIAGIRDKSLACFRTVVKQGLMPFVDIVGFHGLRGTWSDTIPPIPLKLQADMLANESVEMPDNMLLLHNLSAVRAAARESGKRMAAIVEEELAKSSLLPPAEKKPVWLTEYGFPTADPEDRYPSGYLEEIQTALYAYALRHVAACEPERVYWYTLRDRVSPSVRFVTTGWEDVLQHFYGDTSLDGSPKLLGRLLIEGGPRRVMEYVEKNRLWDLVDKASLDRKRPEDYVSQDRPGRSDDHTSVA